MASLARPGGNVTGFTPKTPGGELNGKRLELLKETLPNITRVGILLNPDFAPNRIRLTYDEGGCPDAGVDAIPVEALGAGGLEETFSTLLRERAEGFVVLGDSVLFNYRGQIGAMA